MTSNDGTMKQLDQVQSMLKICKKCVRWYIISIVPDDSIIWQLRNQLKSEFSISFQVPLYGASHMHARNQLSFVQGYQLCTAIGM